MNLTGHIVEKDLRRLVWPWAGWMALVAASTVWIRLVGWDGANREIAEVERWIGTVGWVTQIVGFSLFALQVALIGALVLEDRTTGSDGWWMTRPLSGGRLLTAKLVTATALFIVAPLALTVGLSGVGNVGPATVGSLVSGTFWNAGWVLLAVVLAALTAHLGQMAFAVAAWSGLMWAAVLGLAVAGKNPGIADPALLQARVELASLWPWAAMLMALGWQYRTRRTRGSWAVVVAGLAAAAVFNVAWPEALLPAQVKRVLTPAEEAVTVELKALVTPANRNLPHALFLGISGDAGPGEVFVPWDGKGELRWADGARVPVSFGRGGLWGDQAAMRVAGARPGGGPVRWDMAMQLREVPDGWLRAGTATFSGKLTLARMRVSMAASGPLGDGEAAGRGPQSTRIIGWALSGQPTLLTEERSAGPLAGGVRFAGRSIQAMDTYLLVQRERDLVKALHLRQLGAAAVNGVALRLLALETSAPRRMIEGRPVEIEGWRDGATLVRVRFEGAEYFERTVADLPLTLTTEDATR